MKQKLLISTTALLFLFFSGLRASDSYTTLYSGSPISTGSWDNVSYNGEIAGTIALRGGYDLTDVEWGDTMFIFSVNTVTVQQWQCMSACSSSPAFGWVQLSSVTVSIHDGSAVRMVVEGVGGGLSTGVYVDNLLVVWSWQTSGSNTAQPPPMGHVVNLGYYSGSRGFSWFAYGPSDTTPPTPVPASSIAVAKSTNYVNLQWPQTSDDPNGTGVYEYLIYRNGALIGVVGTSQSLSFTDATVVANTTYSYTLAAFDYHFNDGSTTITVTTTPTLGKAPYPSSTPDGRRVGVRPTGTYWGASGENIDVMSGNLNFTLPLLKAQGRGGWGVPFNLIYNSQSWFKDPNGVSWIYGQDVGYGFGWRLLAGSITPQPNPNGTTLAYYLYTDATGAEYRLDQNSGNIWSSKESIYVWFDANTNMLHFRDGSFWNFACFSSESNDQGTMYPTSMEDANGNEVLIRYQSGANLNWPNSSARITDIEDVRATAYYLNGNYAQPYYHTYAFTYNNDSPPHLTSIANTIGTGETYTFAYASQALTSPFDGSPHGTVALLQTATVSNIGTYHQFTYYSSGELWTIWLPYKGYLQYAYVPQTYPSGKSYRNVQTRNLSKDGVSAVSYGLNWGPATTDVPPWGWIWDSSGKALKFWYFNTSGPSMGLTNTYAGYDWPSWLLRTATYYTWTQDATGNSYISSAQTNADQGQSYQAQKQTNQTVDIYGNVTQVVYYNWGNLSTPYRTDNFTYLNASQYTSRYIFNRMTSSPTTTIQYDQSLMSYLSGVREWDGSVQYVQWRGNPTTVTGPSGTTQISYDMTGNATSTSVNGVATSVSTTSATNYAAPSQMTVGSLSQTMSYTSFLGLTNETGPNGASVSLGYDANARPTSATSPFGAVTTTTYNDTASPPTIVTSINGRWTRQTLDGLGRTILTETGYGGTTVSQAETVYGPCGCSPVGKMIKQAAPHAPGATPAYTIYTYDGIGRTMSVVAPDGASTTTYIYQGNTVTVTDPAGKWKTFITDVLGNLVQVTEPGPSSTAVPITIYNTGVTSPGALAADGATDAHYTLTASADSSYPGPAAKVANSNQFPLPSPWVADGPNSKWIAPRADAGNNNAVGNYTYRTTFDLTGLNSWTAELHGAVGSDNAVTVMLNGTTVAYSTGFTSLTPLTISNGFVAGVNTLDFLINNAGTSPNPTGLRVELAGTAVPSSGSSSVSVTTYSYDRLGHVTVVYMPRSTDTQTRSFNYSGNLLMSATNPENGTVSYTYNSYNKVATRTDAKGQQVVYTYDGYARLTKVQRYPQGTANPEDGCQQENYYYDSNPFDSTYSQNVLGRLAAVQYMGGAAPNPASPGLPPVCNTSFTEMYSYSVPGGVTAKRLRVARTQIWYADPTPWDTTQTMTLDLNSAFAYDNEGRMTSEQYPLSGPNLGFGYDSMGRPYSITDQGTSAAVIASAGYGAAGQLLTLTGGYGGWNGTETRTYNAMLQLTGIASPGWNIQYNYSATQNNGKIVSQTDLVSGEQVSYTYDALNRLASAASNQSWSQSFSYDGFGNLTNVNAANAPGLGVVYDPATNRVPNYSDANGNTTNAAGGYTTVYDVENRMTYVPGYQGTSNYSYAPGNKRVWKGVWNGSAWTTDEVTFWSPSGQKMGTYTLAAPLGCNYYSDPCDGPYAPQFYAVQAGTDYYFGGRLIKNAGGWVYPDRLGSTVRTYPYGVERPSATTNGTEKFTGYFRDAETGLDYADQRYEQPGMGRFLTPDPLGNAKLQDPGSWNQYSYAGGDPINH
ncbi:MAG: RHS repeat-associated core domain-containing protein, partial [Bryobacterales bacterium]|nr:RHS repeat-associated core domain-containing protein [Bryobacterales bacterium]